MLRSANNSSMTSRAFAADTVDFSGFGTLVDVETEVTKCTGKSCARDVRRACVRTPAADADESGTILDTTNVLISDEENHR